MDDIIYAPNHAYRDEQPPSAKPVPWGRSTAAIVCGCILGFVMIPIVLLLSVAGLLIIYPSADLDLGGENVATGIFIFVHGVMAYCILAMILTKFRHTAANAFIMISMLGYFMAHVMLKTATTYAIL